MRECSLGKDVSRQETSRPQHRDGYVENMYQSSIEAYLREGYVIAKDRRVPPVHAQQAHLQLARGALVVSNHPGLLDVVALISCMPQVDCVVKSALWRNWLIRPIIAAAGYIANDLGESVVDEAVRRLQLGRLVLLFPEGTRSPKEGLGPFNRGFARMALQAKCPLVPVIIRCEPRILMKQQSIFSVSDQSSRWSVSVRSPIPVSDFVEVSDSSAIASRKLTDGLRNYFEQELL